MGLVRELGEAFKDTNNIGDILKTWKSIVVRDFSGPELRSGPLDYRWKMIARPLGSLWNTSRGLKPKKDQKKIEKISKFPRKIFLSSWPWPPVWYYTSREYYTGPWHRPGVTLAWTSHDATDVFVTTSVEDVCMHELKYWVCSLTPYYPWRTVV